MFEGGRRELEQDGKLWGFGRTCLVVSWTALACLPCRFLAVPGDEQMRAQASGPIEDLDVPVAVLTRHPHHTRRHSGQVNDQDNAQTEWRWQAHGLRVPGAG